MKRKQDSVTDEPTEDFIAELSKNIRYTFWFHMKLT
jgi:hypothetical protein